MNIAMAGTRGHNGFLLGALPKDPSLRVVGLSAGGVADDMGWVQGELAKADQRPTCFDDVEAMLEETRPEVLVVAGPFERHAEFCRLAFARGIHVFCEKPVAPTLAALDELEAAYHAASASGTVHFTSMMNLRYEPPFRAAWEAVQAGTIGAVRLMQGQKSYRLGTRPPFFHDRATSTGLIPWVGIHAIDLFPWFSGARFEAVFATHSALGNRDHGDLEVSAGCTFAMSGETTAVGAFDYLRPASAPSHGDDRIRVVGTKGVVEVARDEAWLIADPEPGTTAAAGAATATRLPDAAPRDLFLDFVGQIRGEGSCLLPAEEVFHVTRAALTARQAADERRLLQIPDARPFATSPAAAPQGDNRP